MREKETSRTRVYEARQRQPLLVASAELLRTTNQQNVEYYLFILTCAGSLAMSVKSHPYDLGVEGKYSEVLRGACGPESAVER